MGYELDQYRMAVNLAARRFLWDTSSIGLRQKARYKRRWKNKLLGKKVVIMCNGPSLNTVDFDFLKSRGVYTIGLNKINLLFDRTDFRPDCIVAVNPFVIAQSRQFYNETTINLILDWKGSTQANIALRENVDFIFSSEPPGTFSTCLGRGVNQGYTVTYVALQVAYYSGAHQVALVGCDHSFATKGPANKTVNAGEADPNHFDPRYFSNGVEWQLPDLVASEYHYQIADVVFRNAGRRIVNATNGGKLEIFERQELTQFLSE